MTQHDIMSLLREAPNLDALRHVALMRLVTLVERLAQLPLRDRAIFIGWLQGIMPAELGAELGLLESEITESITRIAIQLAEDPS